MTFLYQIILTYLTQLNLFIKHNMKNDHVAHFKIDNL
jgi:hypothetical protein